MNMQPNQLAVLMRQLCIYALMALFVTLVWEHSSHAEEISQSDEPVNEEIDITSPPIETVPIDEVDRGGVDDTHVDLPEKTCTEYYIDENGKEQSRTYPCP